MNGSTKLKGQGYPSIDKTHEKENNFKSNHPLIPNMSIVNASQTLLEIVGNILNINKIEANKMEIVENPI